MSVAEITPDGAKAFCKRWFPDRYGQFCVEIEGHPETLYMNFEEILSAIEGMAPYRVLLDTIKGQPFDAADRRTHLACLLFIHFLRSSAILQSGVHISEQHGRSKFEYFWWLKQMLGNPNALMQVVAPIVFSQWHLYRSIEPVFALPDTPVLAGNRSIMLALCPYLLLEVMAAPQATVRPCLNHASVHKSKLKEYRRRAISSTFKELLCAAPGVATEYAETWEWKERVREAADNKHVSELLLATDARQMAFLQRFLRT